MGGALRSTIDWRFCQANSDQILAEGIFALRSSTPEIPLQSQCTGPGNYLVALDGNPLYVGEGKSLSARLKQQFRLNTSTFYKNYLKSNPNSRTEITEFQAQLMESRIGRKEIEEFGIVNIPTELNRFQLDKRKFVVPASDSSLWSAVQSAYREILKQGEDEFLSQQSCSMFEAEPVHGSGIYAVWAADGQHVTYIGESSDVCKRHGTHCRRTYFSALRRNVGTTVLGFKLQSIKGKDRYFSEAEDCLVTSYLRSCKYSFMPVTFGRLEIEEHLIRNNRPRLNRKVNNHTSAE